MASNDLVGLEIGKVVVDERVSKQEMEAHIAAILIMAQKDDSLSTQAKALAKQEGVFSIDRGANVGLVEGTLLYTFVVAVGKGAASAAGAIIVKELWGFVKQRLQRRDPTGVREVTDGRAEGN
ncbi:hypothetical protein [Roseibium sp. M-1]